MTDKLTDATNELRAETDALFDALCAEWEKEKESILTLPMDDRLMRAIGKRWFLHGISALINKALALKGKE